MQEMKIKYGGGNSISANTYINSLIHFTNIVHEVNREIDPDRRVEVKIKAQKEGSFLVDIVLEATDFITSVKSMFTAENVNYFASLVGGVTGVYQFAKWIKGKTIKSVEKEGDLAKITTETGDVNYFDFRGANIYLTNPTIQSAVAQEFQTLDADENVSSFEILNSQEQELFVADREDFSMMSEAPEKDETQKDIKTIRDTINIGSVVFSKTKRVWDFVYNGNRITAKVSDDEFIARVLSGESFSNGDSLEADIEIKREWDESVNTFVNKSYSILKVYKHFPRAKQSNLFNNDEEA